MYAADFRSRRSVAKMDLERSSTHVHRGTGASVTLPFLWCFVAFPIWISRMCIMGKIVCQEPLRSHKNADFFIFKGEIRISRITTYTVALLPGSYLSGLEITPAYFFWPPYQRSWAATRADSA